MTDSNKWYWLTIFIISGVLIYLLAPVLTPFMIAAVLAYIGDPLVDRLEGYKLSRTLAVIIVFLVLTLFAVVALIILVPMLEKQIVILGQKIPAYIETIQTKLIPWLNARFGLDIVVDPAKLRESLQVNWKEAGGVVTTVLTSISRSGAFLAEVAANLVLIPVVAFYLLRDWDILVARICEMLPRKSEPVIKKITKESDEVLGSFLRGQLLVMLALSLIYSVGLGIVGLELALLIGMIAGLVSFVPYLGFIVGIVIAGIAAIMQFGDITHLVYVGIVFMVGQMLEGMVLTPALVGDRIGLHPVAVIFAVLAGGQLFGFLGVLLALPVAAIIVVILRYLHEQYKSSTMYSG
ncbi:MAG: AI-2E family transporter [Thioalkalispiraceae bacterium]|jgi:predicted PurR-regulated permease PerM